MGFATYNNIQMGSLGGRVPAFGELDPYGVTKFFAGTYRQEDFLLQGVVVTYNPHAHCADVNILGRQGTWVCYFADELLSYSFGFSTTNPAREGEIVLVMRIAPDEDAGIIIGRIPYLWNFSVNGDLYEDPDQYHRRLYTQDEEKKETWDRNVPSIIKPLNDEFDDSTHLCTHFRPTDIYPGEFAHVNQHNCGIKGGLFSATLLGGGANVRVSGISNTARVSCEHYKRFSLLGSYHEFHNGKYVSSERNVAYYQEERLGGTKRQDKVWKEDSIAPIKGMNQTIRPRIKDFSGFFGHIKSNFCLRPDQDESDVREQGKSKPKEEGVSRETVDPSGQYRISAAGMLTMERTGRIPVPVRTCYPTDKDHDIKSAPEVLTPFEHSLSDHLYRQLELFDRQAYDLKNQYARLDGLGFTPDYDVPQEEELKPLKDQYDKKFLGNKTVELEKYDKRRAGMYIGEDGSIILRDAWGSELVMIGGNVTISCAGNVMLLPGLTQLTIAGDDIIQKAQNSIDIHASKHDVRLSAARNMEILGGGDDSKYSGGVIIESRGSKNASPWDGKDKGESARVTGITLRTKNQGVVVDGQNLILRSRKATSMVSGDKDVDGSIYVSAKQTIKRAKTILDVTGGSTLQLTEGQAVLAGKSVVVGGSSLYLDNNGKTCPMWVDAKDVTTEIISKSDSSTENLADEEKASLGFSAEALEKMIFGFRTSDECRTMQPWSIDDIGPADFRLYEPAWAQVSHIYETLKNGNVDTVPYEEDPEWENGRPFPGEDEETSATYAKCDPKNLTGEGFNKSRKAVENRSEITTEPFLGGYLIRKQ